MSQPIYFESASPMVTRSKKRRFAEMSGGAPEGRGPLTKRKCLSEFQIQEFLEYEIGKSHQKLKKVKRSKDLENLFSKSKKQKYRGLLVRKELTQEKQAMVIFLRYGSINSDKHEWLSPTEVFKRTGVKLNT